MPATEATLAELAWIRDDYGSLVASARPEDLVAPSRGTRWMNRELLFHMWFGQRIARVFIPLMGGFGRLPRPVSAAYARLLTAMTRPYDWINYAAPVGGVRAVGLGTAVRWMDADTRRLLTWAGSATEEQLAVGMCVPEAWDHYFTGWMTRDDVLRWAPKHYRHHRAQLSLSTL